jgi:hypothetical protein
MDIELKFKTVDGEEKEKNYAYESIEHAAYFMGLLQQGIKFDGEMYVMEDHYLDVTTNTVTVHCITVKAAEAKMAEAQRNMMSGVSPEFLDRLRPVFRNEDDDGCCGGGNCGGDSGCGGGFIN